MSTTTLKSLLPTIPFEKKETMTALELFQNEILRPILKFQNAGLCRLTLSYCYQMNPAFSSLSATKKRKMINELLSGNQALRNQLTGMIISFLDDVDWQFYETQQKDIHKRIIQMITVRVLDGFEKFVK